MQVEFTEKENESFIFEQLNPDSVLDGFCCSISEYNSYLTDSALRSRQDNIALTWLLRKVVAIIATSVSLLLMPIKNKKKMSSLSMKKMVFSITPNLKTKIARQSV
jgi:hypothetical protein